MSKKYITVTARISKEDKEKLLFFAKDLGLSPASIFSQQIEDFIENQEALRSESFQRKLKESRNSGTLSAEESKRILSTLS